MKRADTYIDEEMMKRGIKSDSELAKSLKISQQSLSFRLSGKLSMDTLERLSKLFGISVKELLK